MIVDGEFLSRLRKIFDLNLYEVKVWTSLLSRGVSTAGELSSISDVPRSRTYDILESLEKKGFIIMKLGKPNKAGEYHNAPIIIDKIATTKTAKKFMLISPKTIV